jgi:hypothetical protein
VSIFPFEEGEWYSVGQLREAAKAISDRMRSDKEFGDAIRVNDQRRLPRAKAWREELYPCKLLSDRLSLADDAKFSWTQGGAADVEFRSGERTIRLQCTTAHAHWANSLGEQGGHLRKLEMRQGNAEGFHWRGGRVSEPTVQDSVTDLETWRTAIADALENKIKADYSGCWLLIYAVGCDTDMVGDDFREVVVPATERVGRAKWEAVFEGLYILGDQPANFAEVRSNRGQ